MSCLAQDGASYHESPMRMSSLPSLFTSAVATPSERNFPSIVVFFQEIRPPAPGSEAPAEIERIAEMPRKVAQFRTPMVVSPRRDLEARGPPAPGGGMSTR